MAYQGTGRIVSLELETTDGQVLSIPIEGEVIWLEEEALEIPPLDDMRWQTDPRYRGLLRDGSIKA